MKVYIIFNYFWRKKKNIKTFLVRIFIFYSLLHGQVFVMILHGQVFIFDRQGANKITKLTNRFIVKKIFLSPMLNFICWSPFRLYILIIKLF